jgi:DICT domain-containing protein
MIASMSNTIDTTSVFDLINDVPGHFLQVKRTMVQLSHALEEEAARATKPCRMFVGFQRFSLFAKEAERYARLAQHYDSCIVFGVADQPAPQIPGVIAVEIAADSPLAKEWFVVADGPTFGSALLTADTNEFAVRSRRFLGLWSAEPSLVRAASTRLATALELAPPTWEIDLASTLRGFTTISNQMLAQQEERNLLGKY